MRKRLKRVWQGIRQLSGDDAYERYLQHHAAHHQHEGSPPLSKAEFFKRWQDRMWSGIKRCC
ncbi:YbdD/YjiX family protein [Methylicorpusculum oleiharenae]|uniref:CstA-like transporter-associated (seleno)protein n=1 Tax=Methylicorpusculum oleiharenae TaxID=1338687 RepID=UPI00135C553C|nr:YbdD/YjiX family protein [Methylicorpusculum oleiharenae]MCD2448795.1 YbdD/YjiX family protein [Methylicorpusculum oleiharenae]